MAVGITTTLNTAFWVGSALGLSCIVRRATVWCDEHKPVIFWTGTRRERYRVASEIRENLRQAGEAEPR